MIEIAVRNVGVHPIIKIAYSRQDIRITRHEVGPESKVDGKKLDEIDIDPKTGFKVMALRRDTEWFLDPPKGKKLQEHDVLIVEGNDVKLLYHNRNYLALLRQCPNLYLETHNLVLYSEIEHLAARASGKRPESSSGVT